MYESEPNPRRMLAVIFGASDFHLAPKLAQGRAFNNSAQDFCEYLTSSSGLGIPRENVRWLFDDSRAASDQLQAFRDFLNKRSAALKNEGVDPDNLIVYYVGHGLFSGPEHSYCLAVRVTDEQDEGPTSLRISDLASYIKRYAAFLRKFLILDCCFSASAYKEFQSGPLTLAREKLLDELPTRGTTLLCSASAREGSLAPEGLPRTMFSDGLLRALQQGHHRLGPRLSLSELGSLVQANICEAYPSSWVRPEVHSPDQREGDVASIPLFPNAAYGAQKTEEEGARQKAEETQRKAEEEAEFKRKAQEEAEAEAKRKAREQREIRRKQVLAEAARKNHAEEEKAKRAAAKAEKERLEAKEAKEAKEAAAKAEKERLRAKYAKEAGAKAKEAEGAATKAEKERLRAVEAMATPAKVEKNSEVSETERRGTANRISEIFPPRLKAKKQIEAEEEDQPGLKTALKKLILLYAEMTAEVMKKPLSGQPANKAKRATKAQPAKRHPVADLCRILLRFSSLNALSLLSGAFMAIAIDKWMSKSNWSAVGSVVGVCGGVAGLVLVQVLGDDEAIAPVIALISLPGFLTGFRFLNGLSSTVQPSAWYAAAAVIVFLAASAMSLY